MTTQSQLERMADSLLAGTMSVENAEARLGGKVVHTKTLGPAEASDAQKAHVASTRRDVEFPRAAITRPQHESHWPGEAPVDVVALQAKRHVQRKNGEVMPLCELLVIDLQADKDDISLPSQTFASALPEDDFYHQPTPRLKSKRTHARTYSVPVFSNRGSIPATAKYEEEAAAWDESEWNRLRWPVVAFRPAYNDPNGFRPTLPGDDEHGYVADPTWIESQARLDAELRAPWTRSEEEFVTEDGWIILDDNGERQTRVVESEVMGAVEWEARRRNQGRQPWMHPKTFRWVNDLERRRELLAYQPWLADADPMVSVTIEAAHRMQLGMEQNRQAAMRKAEAKAVLAAKRTQLIALIRTLGQDPKTPEVAGWVKRVGIETALAKLEQRIAA